MPITVMVPVPMFTSRPDMATRPLYGKTLPSARTRSSGALRIEASFW
jgi:hypothetical protein